MASYIVSAPAHGFTVEQVTQGQRYPVAEVEQFLGQSGPEATTDISEAEALHAIDEAVDTSNVTRLGEGPNVVYAYGYHCAPDRLKVGLTVGNTVQRIVNQIGTSTPDKPVLLLEIRTHDSSALERAIHAVLEYRGMKVVGGGKEWFKTSRELVVEIYQSVINMAPDRARSPD